MSEAEKTRSDLETELEALRQRVCELQGHEAELERAKLALKEGEARLRQIIDLVPHMIFAKDWDGRFLLANKAVAEAYGTTVEALTGTRHAEHHSDKGELDRMLADDREVMRSGVPKFIAEETFIDAMGKRRVLQTIKIPYTISGKDERAVLGVALDVTDRKKVEEERRRLETRIKLAEKRESLTTLAGGLAQDFNELVTSILDNAALARAVRAPTAEGRELLDKIELAARSAANLTNQLLVYAGEVPLQRCALFLNHLVEDTAHVLEAIVSKRAKVRYDFSGDMPPILADAGQLRQVIVNLVTNASEALGGKSGTVTVATGVCHCSRQYLASTYVDDDLPEGQYVYLEVSDTGSGMSAEELARMFDPFFSRKFTEGGLGLAAVLGVVREHKGTIHVKSAPGAGTAVRVLLPTPAAIPFSNA